MGEEVKENPPYVKTDYVENEVMDALWANFVFSYRIQKAVKYGLIVLIVLSLIVLILKCM